ncbi:MAG: hypothetical protein QF495_08980, partial [SAR324 cluster bacterium]|nr:hypothetical protein [SAR324 cluster bacterium]
MMRWIMEQRSATVTVEACAIKRRTSRAEAGLARIPTEIICEKACLKIESSIQLHHEVRTSGDTCQPRSIL